VLLPVLLPALERNGYLKLAPAIRARLADTSAASIEPPVTASALNDPYHGYNSRLVTALVLEGLVLGPARD
jgi:hypothetical protein